MPIVKKGGGIMARRPQEGPRERDHEDRTRREREEFKGEHPRSGMTDAEAEHEGGQRVRELIEEGKDQESEER